MAYIIDGHNLIPKIPGLSLSALDDEQELIQLLQDFYRVSRKKVEVYFDKAAPGAPRAKNYGVVAVRFARHGQTADQAIGARLKNMGRSARNWTIVSSDLAVQAYARQARATVMSAEAFSARLGEIRNRDHSAESDRAEKQPDPEEVEQWLQIFQNTDRSRPPKQT